MLGAKARRRGWPGLPALLGRLALALAVVATSGLPAQASDRPDSAARDEPFRLDTADPRVLLRADLAITDSATPPGPGAPWQAVTLPDVWRAPERHAQGINGWYRFRVQGPAPAEPQSLYLWRFSMNAAVYFNGEWIGDGGTFDEPIARNWNRPMLLRLPAAMWHAGENALLIRLRVYPGFGNLLPPALGPTRLLQPHYEQRMLAQVTAAQVSALAMGIAMLAGLLLWVIDRRDRTALYFSALCAAMTLYAVNKFIQTIPVEALTWWRLVHWAIDAAMVLLVLFIHRALGVRKPRLEGALALLLVLFGGLYALWSLPQLARYNPLLHGISALSGLYLLGWLLLRLWRRPSAETAGYAAVVGVILVVGGYDQLLNSLLVPALWGGGTYLLTLFTPLLLLAMVGHLGLRAMRAVRELRLANESLDARVRQAGAEVGAVYQRERRLLGERAAAQERERIYRDLHDNLGARLLGLVYGAADEPQRARARSALAEMRTIIAVSQVEAGPLADVAAEWRLEAELRCEAAACELIWHGDGDSVLTGPQRFHLERIVRELISNALEHAGCGRLEVLWRVQPGELELCVRDDGKGLPEGAAPAGVRARVADLLGQVRWESGPDGGCACTVQVPLSASGAVANDRMPP